LNALEQIIKFINDWTGLSASPAIIANLPTSAPEPLKTLSREMGAFWENPPYPYAPKTLNGHTKRGLFLAQDYIKNPFSEKPNAEGLIPLISENQGVWHFSYSQEHQLFYQGDWSWGSVDSSPSPVPFPATIMDALCFALLGNFFAYMDNVTWQDISIHPDDTWPDDIVVKLWNHSAWNNYKGFWTNEERTALLYDGVGLIRKT